MQVQMQMKMQMRWVSPSIGLSVQTDIRAPQVNTFSQLSIIIFLNEGGLPVTPKYLSAVGCFKPTQEVSTSFLCRLAARSRPLCGSVSRPSASFLRSSKSLYIRGALYCSTSRWTGETSPVSEQYRLRPVHCSLATSIAQPENGRQQRFCP